MGAVQPTGIGDKVRALHTPTYPSNPRVTLVCYGYGTVGKLGRKDPPMFFHFSARPS